ncbi:hypothetical protein HLB23_10260 [Nocardia uniformis]|uniref:Uncharacterized protein n=1 Tax=Nocardia uniformis TaxID=53432 RepID=A0A849CB98_9NOCA|nr:hypothetical protein [Nocardia uniformis]NNH70241.1 hypothetical protein [Nocardia uniformis]
MGEERARETDTVLSIGLNPNAVDFSGYPGQNAETLTARIEAGNAALRDAGFDIVLCLIPAGLDEAEAKVRECLAGGDFRVAMIGAGVRMAPEHTLLFERLLNVITELSPGIRFCFNTSPETTIDAVRRWVEPRAH